MKNLILFALLLLSIISYGQNELIEAIKIKNYDKAKDLIENKNANVKSVDENGASVLMWAAYKGDIDFVKYLNSKGADPEQKGVIYIDTLGTYYGNLLCVAAGEGNLDMMKYFLNDLQLNINENVSYPENKKGTGWSPLNLAVASGNVTLVKFLLKKGATANIQYAEYVNNTPSFVSPITIALELYKSTKEENYIIITKLLIKHLDDIDKTDMFGFAPLHWFVMYGHLELSEYILKKGAKVDVKTNTTETNKIWLSYTAKSLFNIDYEDIDTSFFIFPPILFALALHNFELADLLVKYGADLNALIGGTSLITPFINEKDTTIVFWLINHNVITNKNVDNSFDAMQTAIMANNYNAVVEIYESGYDINKPDENGWTPLFLAILKESDCITEFIIDKADVNRTGFYHCTPLFYAISRGYRKAIELLIKKGCHIDILDKTKDKTPLMFAFDLKLFDVVTLLINKGANLNLQDELLGNTILHYVAAYGNPQLLQLLIPKFKNVDIKNKFGQTPLHWATKSGNWANTKILIENSAVINIKDMQGFVPLHYAVISGNIQLVDYLLDNGAVPDSADYYGQTPLLFALQKKYYDIAKVLLDKGANVNIGNPISWIVFYNDKKALKMLIENGASIDIKNFMGHTPLMSSVYFNFIHLVEILYQYDKNLKSLEYQNQIREIAEKRGLKLILKFLDSKGAIKLPEISCNDYLLLAKFVKDNQKKEELLLDALSSLKTEVDTTTLIYAEELYKIACEYNHNDSTEYIKSLFETAYDILKKDTDDSKKINIELEIAKILSNQKKYDSAKMYLNKVIVTVEEIVKDTDMRYYYVFLATAYEELGKIYENKEIKDSALIFYRNSIIYLTLSGSNDWAGLENRICFLNQNRTDFRVGYHKYSEKFINYDIMGSEKKMNLLYESTEFYNEYNNYVFYNRHADFLHLNEDKKQTFSQIQQNKKSGNYLTGNETEEIFHFSIFLKNALLRSDINTRETINKSNDEFLKNKYNELLTLRRKIGEYHRLLSENKLYSDSIVLCDNKETYLTQEIENSCKEYFYSGQEGINNKYNKIKTVLMNDDALIEFISFNQNKDKTGNDSILYGALLLQNDTKYPMLIYLFEQKELQRNLSPLDSLLNHDSINTKMIYSYYNNGKDLYDILIKPFESCLAGRKKIYISPTGLLHRVSFAAIPISQDSVLSDKYEIEYIMNSTSILEKDSIKIDNMALFGNIDFDSASTALQTNTNLLALNKSHSVNKPNGNTNNASNKDVKGYVKPIKDSHVIPDYIDTTAKKSGIAVNIYRGTNATEENFYTLDGVPISLLHYDTHGKYITKAQRIKELEQRFKDIRLNEDPMYRSYLTMAGCNDSTKTGEDGWLTAYEVSNTDLSQTQLVVMSACETALGDIEGNEGIFGLLRGFKMAGVRYIMATLWSVDAVATNYFMELFYERLFKENQKGYINVEKVFSNAQNEMRKHVKYGKSPYYWAGFVLIN